MELQVHSMTEQHGKEICTWSYPAPYDIYNWPSWGIMIAEELQFTDVAIREAQFAAVIRFGRTNTNRELIGYVQYFPMEGVVRLGLGIRPDCCDQGIGQAFMKAIIKEAIKRYPDHEIDLEVHTWNERAQKTYTKAGFIRTDEYEKLTPVGVGIFYCMVYSEGA